MQNARCAAGGFQIGGDVLMITLWQSMNPILQLAWLPILGAFAAVIGWGLFTAAKSIIKTAVMASRESNRDRYDSSWMSIEKYIGLK